MGRIIFAGDEQIKFLRKVKEISGLNNEEIASLCGVHGRTFRDWARGKYSISEKAFRTLIAKYQLPLPESISSVGDYWYVTKGAKKGALRRMELYGPSGYTRG